MSATIASMTKNELEAMIGTVVEQKLVELLGDPDEGKSLKKAVQDRLIRQKAVVARGQRGKRLEEVVQRLGLQ
jgi:hypothetical protein